MIRVPEARQTDYRQIEEKLSTLRSLEGVREFYKTLVERYTTLNAKFCFSESFREDYVFAQLDERWPMRERDLFGIPFGVKDVFNTAVLPTSMGSEIWKGFLAGNNARVVDEIAACGGILFAKTTTAEFAVHYIQDGKTINPHNPKHITGTSSAGSAVAVASGALPICLGTQTGGSIVRPASFCGVFGFKPSFGAYDRTGTLKTADTLDTIGLLGSDIYGLRKAFAATFQKDPQYPAAVNYFDRLKTFRGKRRLKIGVVSDQYSGYARYDAHVKDDFTAAIDRLANTGLDIAPVTGMEFINDIHLLHEQIYCKSLSYYFQNEYSGSRVKMSEVMTDMISLGSQISVDDYVNAVKQQPEYRRKFDAVMRDYDFLLTPSTASVAPVIGGKERDDTCLVWTFLGYPAISLPVFWSVDAGLPFGLQVVAPKFCDLALLEFADGVVSGLGSSPCQ